MNSFLPDLRFAIRTYARQPLFTFIAIVSLALGIGANTAIFTIMDQLMLRPLPIRDPNSLVMLYQTGPNNGSNVGDRMNSYPVYADFQQKGAPLSEVLCRRLVDTSVAVDNVTERVSAEMVSGNYFTMLGVHPAAGRLFTVDFDGCTGAATPVVSDLFCTVLDCGSSFGSVNGCTCVVTTP